MIMTWSELSNIVGAKEKLHTLLYGPPGTGKSRAAQDVKCYALTMTPETPAAEIRGHYIPEGSVFKWHDGPGLRAWREGCRLVVNEIDMASGDALTFLHVLLDDLEMAQMTLPTGETVRPAHGFHVVATMNGEPGSLPAALLDRFSARVNVDEPHPDALKRLPIELANVVKSTVLYGEERKISLRQALAFIQMEKHLGDDLAARAIWAERASDILTSLKLARVKNPAPAPVAEMAEEENDLMSSGLKDMPPGTPGYLADRCSCIDCCNQRVREAAEESASKATVTAMEAALTAALKS